MKKNNLLPLIGYFSYNFFTVILVLYLVLFFLENIFPGFVSNNFDPNLILIPLFILGILTAIFPQPEAPTRQTKPSLLDYLLVTGFTTLTFIIVWYKLADLGKISLFVALGSSLIVFLVSILMLFSPEEEAESVEVVKLKPKQLKTFKFRGIFVISFFSLLIPLLLFFLISAKKNQPLPTKQKLEFIPVQIINQGASDNEVNEIKIYLQSLGFTVEKVIRSAETNKIPILKFDSADAEIAQYLEKNLTSRYPLLEKLPLPDTADPYPHLILVLVGK